MKKYFLDVNILIDYFFDRQTKDSNIKKLLKEADTNHIYVSGLSAHIIFYVLRVKHGTQIFLDIKSFLERVNIIPLTGEIVNSAMNIEFKDFEDTLQYFSAVKNCDYILTRDKKDFEKIQRLSPSPLKIVNRYHL
jgi:predicted nucleic acid-binding protein